MKKLHIRILVSAGLLVVPAAAYAQPCFTAPQCAQIRLSNERMLAEQQAAQQAAAAARAQAEAETARLAVQERARQMAERRQAEIEQYRWQLKAQIEQARAQAEEERRQVLWRAEQAGIQAEAEQRSRVAAALRVQQQAEQQAVEEEQRRQAVTESERRATAQLAAETSPDNHCRDQRIAGDLIDYFNGLQQAADYSARAVDIDHLSTINFDGEHHVMSCHGAFVLQNGASVTGTLTTRLNVAGRVLKEFHRD